MNKLDIRDYYKILNLSYSDSERIIYKKYKLFAFNHHPEKGNKSNIELFISSTEAYLILEYKPFRTLYNKFYQFNILGKNEYKLEISEMDLLIKIITEAKSKAVEYSKINFKLFWKKIPKKMSILENVISSILGI